MCLNVLIGKNKENEGHQKDGEDGSSADEESDEERPSTPPRRVIELTEYVERNHPMGKGRGVVTLPCDD